MISGAHVIVYSEDAEAERALFRDVLDFPSVDAGRGWLIFALPPGEAAFHPSEKNGVHELYFLCDNLKSEMADLEKKGVTCSAVHDERWGSITKFGCRAEAKSASTNQSIRPRWLWANRQTRV